MEPVSFLGLLLKQVTDLVSSYFRKKTENQIEAASRQMLTWFEEAPARGVHSRFCPSRADILEAFKTDHSAETVSRTLAQKTKRGLEQ
jgi:hypothetical protein